MTTGTPLESQTEESVTTAKVMAVCYSPELINHVGKEVHEEAHITKWGVPTDRHYGATRWSSRAHKDIPNNRPITVVGYEAGHAACQRLGCEEIQPGGLGENVLLEGAGDLSELRAGDEIRFAKSAGEEPSVVLEVRKQNPPCSNLQIYHKMMTKELMGKRGVICTVLKEGVVRTGDVASIVHTGKNVPEDTED